MRFYSMTVTILFIKVNQKLNIKQFVSRRKKGHILPNGRVWPLIVITLSIFFDVFSTSVCPLLYCGWLVDFSVLSISYSLFSLSRELFIGYISWSFWLMLKFWLKENLFTTNKKVNGRKNIWKFVTVGTTYQQTELNLTQMAFSRHFYNVL